MSEEIEYANPEPGEWVLPVMNGYRMRCCDCKLVHSITFEAGRMLKDGAFLPDHNLRVMFRVERDELETEKARAEMEPATPAKAGKPRQTPPKAKKPAPRAGKAPQGAGKARTGALATGKKPTKTNFQTGSHISAAERNFCWATVPENDETGEE